MGLKTIKVNIPKCHLETYPCSVIWHNITYVILDTCVLQAIPNKSDNFHTKSDNVTLTILINPVNDQKPVLVNKVVLVVWQNSVTEITPSDLKYADNDTAPEDLMFKAGIPGPLRRAAWKD